MKPRRAFVAVVAANVLVTGTAAANPPAPSEVPDPAPAAPPKPDEQATHIKRHSSGCFVYYPSGATKKIDCPTVMDHPSEIIDREPTTGQCILFEPWEEEPKETPCPPVLVPAGFVPPAPKAAPKTASLATPDPAAATKKAGCARCDVAHGASSGGWLALAAVALASARRRR